MYVLRVKEFKCNTNFGPGPFVAGWLKFVECSALMAEVRDLVLLLFHMHLLVCQMYYASCVEKT